MFQGDYMSKRVLIGCEESQVVTCAFRELGIEAFSCDLKPTSGFHPEWHITGDLLSVIDDKWDLLIAFPPCTYLSNAGATRLFPGGVLNEDRYKKGLEGKAFFETLLNCGIPRICLENPVPSSIYKMPPASQLVQPFYFGHPYTKRTYLWLRNLPILFATDVVIPETDFVHHGYKDFSNGDRQTLRAKTMPGMAQAMASQWGCLL